MRRLKKIFKILMTAIIIICTSLFIIYYWFHIDSIKITGIDIYTEEDIKGLVFSRKLSDNELVLWMYNKLFGIDKLPFIEDIDVKYVSHNSVEINVYEKTLSGCIKYMGHFVYFDKDGRVLESLSEHKQGVPVVTGIEFCDFTLGEQFDVDDDTLFKAIMNVSQLISHYNIDVKRIHVNKGDIMIYSGNVQIYLGKRAFYDDQLAALSSVLKTANKVKLSGVIDMENYKSGDKIVLKKN